MTPLLIVDGHHLLYRSWWGFTDRRVTSRDGTRDLTGVFGFLAILRKTHLEAAPEHEIVVVFDGENATAVRQDQDTGYKSGRASADHTPIQCLPMVKACLAAAGIAWVELDDHEGDDVIATLSSAAATAGRTVVCYSGDRDLFQLVTDTVTVLNPARRRITPADIVARHRVLARQWPDFRALTGDPTDNIPGVRGIGPTTAADLLADGIHLDQLRDSPRLQQRRCRGVTDAWQQVLTWRDLIRLNHQVPTPTGLVTGNITPPMQRAALTLEDLDLR
ncbi:5'-3' exonuclease H3TH domain-containing protein [Dactylosporangium sp. NPDC051485]|uniref:5'-3' exonuclease n=1 Tax=Dactylosporangium sp. NPDC051485 TaxID=3154846 RepID=UPI003428369D